MERLLLDTHAFLWWVDDDPALGRRARALIADSTNLVFVSAATAWEIAVKRANGKLEFPADIRAAIEGSRFVELEITSAHAVESAELPRYHRDPFDRLLIAQARLDRLTLVAHDDQIARYDVPIFDATE